MDAFAASTTTVPAETPAPLSGELLCRQNFPALDLANLAFWTWDLQTGDFVFNPGWPALLGYEPGELTARYSTFEDMLHGEDVPLWRSAVEKYLGGHASHFKHEGRVRTKNGSWKWVLTRGTSVERDAEGKPLRISGVHLDIHDFKAELDALKHSYATQASFHELISLSLLDLPLPDLLTRCLDLLFTLPWLSAFAARGAIFLADVQKEELRLTSHKNLPAEQVQRCGRLPFGECLCGQAAVSRKPVVSYRLPENLVGCDPGLPAYGFYTLPMIGANDQLLGVLTLAFKAGHRLELNESAYLANVAQVMVGLIERKLAEERLHHQTTRLRQILETLPSLLIAVDTNNVIRDWNPAAEKCFGLSADQVLGRILTDCPIPWQWTEVMKNIPNLVNRNSPTRLKNIRFTRPDGQDGILDLTIAPVYDSRLNASRFILLGTDITEYKLLEQQLVQSQKLESIGQLAAGIAHEINTPIQYVGDNIRFFQEAFGDLARLVEKFREAQSSCQNGHVPDGMMKELQALVEEVDADYLLEETSKAIIQSLEGVDRVATIVRAMKDFAHPDTSQKKCLANLNQGIVNTVTIARNEWKYVAETELHLDARLPMVPCLPGEINQVILNLIVNAAHAIGDSLKGATDRKGLIKISTQAVEKMVEIRIADTGPGIPESIRDKVFNPFFTTKEVGKGTGQGLAIARSVVVDKHGGSLTFESVPGQGTTFFIRLPLEAKEEATP